jgi:protein-disulfide isomerase
MRNRWIPITFLTLGAVGLIAAVVSISVGEEGVQEIRLEETGEVQELIAGIPQLDSRLGNSDAPVTINLFLDVQCRVCADYASEVVNPVIADYVRTGEAQIILRHRPVGTKPATLGAFGTLAAAEQGRGWQYAEIFMLNLDQVPELGVDEDFLNEVAAVTPKLDTGQWERDVLDEGVRARAQEDDELAAELRIPGDTAFVIDGAGGSETLERAPPLADVIAAIERVQ